MQTIAAEISFRVLVLLVLTIGLAGFLRWETARTQAYLDVVAHGEDPSAVLLERVGALRDDPPGPVRDGVWRLAEK